MQLVSVMASTCSPLQSRSAGSLLTVWQSSSWTQRNELVNQLAQLMQSISEEEAQRLPNKDPDVAGMHDKLYGLLNRCCCCKRLGGR